MLSSRRVWAVGMAALFALNAAGCLFHELKPHRMWRWNRTEPMTREPVFSVPTPELPADWDASEPEQEG